MANDERSFLSRNLSLIRDLRCISRDELAARVATTARHIGAIERGQQPGSVLVAALSEVLEVPEEFFFEAIGDEFLDSECAFRRRASTPARVRRRALARGTFLSRLVGCVEGHLDLPEPNVPTVAVTSRADIERATEICRMTWGLGRDTPILNMVRVLENAGVVVGVFEIGEPQVDAFSRPGRRDIVALSHDKLSGARCRFDAAHELGHLVMHRGKLTGSREIEAEADAFASAFLLPRSGFAREYPRGAWTHWDTLIEMKSRWRASIQAMIRRAFDLSLITAVTYQSACKYVSWRGWRKSEPGEFDPEEPELTRLAIAELAELGISIADLARDLSWSTDVLGQIARVETQPGTGAPAISSSPRATVTRINREEPPTA